MSFDGAFREVAALMLAAAVVGAVAVRLRQPLIVAFIAVGVIAGPSVLDVVRAEDEIHLLAELGIALVLVVVGLKLDVRAIRVAVITGGARVAVTAVVGFGLALLLGLEAVTAAYVAMALTFSSTIIVIKLLSDRREIDELHGAGHRDRAHHDLRLDLRHAVRARALEGVRWVGSTVRRHGVGLALLHALEHHGYAGQVLLSAHDAEEAEDLLARGAHHVLQPYEAAAADAVASITATLGATAESSSWPVPRTPPAERASRGL